MYIKGRENKKSYPAVETKKFSSIIALPDNGDQVKWLEAKLSVYHERKNTSSMVAPEFIRFKGNDYKIAILSALLEKGRADVQKIAARVKAEEGESFDLDKFQSAVLKIQNFCEPDQVHMYEGSSMVFAHQ